MKNKKTYFSLFQEDDYLATGLNSETKKEAVEAGIDYALSDLSLSKKERNLVLALSTEEQENYLMASANIRVDEHEEKQLEPSFYNNY